MQFARNSISLHVQNALYSFCLHEMSIFNRYISVYNGVTDKVGTTTMLGNFLRSKRHISRILDLRAETDTERRKAIKLSLPAATISGWFSPARKVENLQQHSGFICIDIDEGDNLDLGLTDIRDCLASRPDVAYAAKSVGGNGMFAIIPLAWPDRHEEQFDALKLDFKEQYGVTLDKSCRDVTRLRVLSYDENPYINENAVAYEGIEVFTPTLVAPSLTGRDGDIRKVERCVQLITEHGIDITGSYEDWFRIGASLTALGEDGRYYFHMVSKQYPGYKYAETDRKYTELLRGSRGIGLGTFFYWCAQQGITYKKEY